MAVRLHSSRKIGKIRLFVSKEWPVDGRWCTKWRRQPSRWAESRAAAALLWNILRLLSRNLHLSPLPVILLANWLFRLPLATSSASALCVSLLLLAALCPCLCAASKRPPRLLDTETPSFPRPALILITPSLISSSSSAFLIILSHPPPFSVFLSRSHYGRFSS